MIDSGLEAKPVWSYSKSKGVYAGLQLDGTIILKVSLRAAAWPQASGFH
jgi:lipid-binding SYLF domain-containing protein